MAAGMQTWSEIAVGNKRAAQRLSSSQEFSAAQRLRAAGYYRSSVSRSYYAAFSAATDVLLKSGAVFPAGYECPPHRDVPVLLERHMGQLGRRRLSEVKSAVRRLYSARLEADYRERTRIDEAIARNALRDACTVLRELGVPE